MKICGKSLYLEHKDVDLRKSNDVDRLLKKRDIF